MDLETLVQRRWWLASAYVALSSWLGLCGTWFFQDPGDAVGFFVDIWSASLMADAVFVAGTLASLYLGLHLFVDHGLLVSSFALLSGNWATYAMSFLLLPPSVGGPEAGYSIFEPFSFTFEWGWVGLVFATLAPILVLKSLEHQEEGPAAAAA